MMRYLRAPWRRSIPTALLLLVLVAVVGCGTAEQYPQSTLHPKGDFAALVDGLFMKTVWWATVVFILVEGGLLWAIYRYRGKHDDPEPKQIHGSTLIEIIWTVVPAVVLAIVAVPTVQAIFSTAKMPEASAEGGAPMVVEVTGHQWWWEFYYPEYGIRTANELHIAVGRTVDLRMKTVDVLHSFWVPQFAGKRDVFPNRETRIWFTAKEAGDYPGACAEFCGEQHARMLFYTMARPADEFAQWVTARQADSVAFSLAVAAADSATPAAAAELQVADAPPVAEGRRLFAAKGCAGCHSLQGVGAPRGMIGPNLSGIGRRRFIAAGWLENTDDNLKHWIMNPASFKSGVKMPTLPMTDAEAEALVAFLRTKQ